MKKIIEIELDAGTFKTVPPSLYGLTPLHKFDLRDVLLHIGTSTSHPSDHGISINNFWAYLRYINCFESLSDFKLNEKWNDIDPHQKTILSDDFGMGFASYYLTYKMNLIMLIDTSYCIKHLPSLASNRKRAKGQRKTPDFMLLDSSFDIHLLECKGTQTTIKKLDKQISTGISQKNSINDPKGIISERLVTGIFIPQYTSNEKAKFKIIDPEFDLDFSDIDKEELVLRLFQGQLAKELHLANEHKLAQQIADVKNLSDTMLRKLFTNDRLEKLENRNEINAYGASIEFRFETDGINYCLERHMSLSNYLKYVKEKIQLNKEEKENFEVNRSEEFQQIHIYQYSGIFGLKMNWITT